MKTFKHNLSYYNLLTCDMGKLIPIGLTEALPGDVFQHHANAVIRVSPLAAPVMHHVTARIHHFFVPHRLVWDGWEDFITGGPDGNDSSTIPQYTLRVPNNEEHQIADYFGVPHDAGSGFSISALPIRGYNMIFNEYYRDQDLVTALTTDQGDIQNIAWEKDYFTTCRPWTQKGPDVTLPVGTKAYITHDGNSGDLLTTKAPNIGASDYNINSGGSYAAGSNNTTGTQSQLYADLASNNAVNVNDFRKAFALQRYQEARARYGSRYVEYLRFLGVRPRDERLQRPEFLGGGNAQIHFSEVLQTAPETGISPTNAFGVGDMYGHGIAAMRSNKYRRMMEEHGYVISLLSVRPKSVYFQGVDRTWLRQDKEDFFQKELQHIGQQEVYNGELWADSGADPRLTFGYQDRYAEYRQGYNRVTSEFRSLLDYWHMARDFSAQSVLNQSFTDCNPTKRIHNEQTKHALWVMVQHRLAARRMVDRSATARIY